ncbi:MAG TPA: S46 family peptidase [Methylomirabilota bacterium]|nr:S46 family peptidase [Methylomirabilota bacterium]
MKHWSRFTGATALAAALLAQPLCADEGMWLFNDPPRKQLREKYGFQPSEAWLEHVQKSSVRFNSGGSGSFVSEDGLVMSNHHVGADCLQKLGTEQHNYYRDGFYAKTLEEEKACPDLELNVLMSIEDVTDRVNAAVKPGTSGDEAFAARRAVMAQIEKESLDKTGFRSDVVTLYQGGKYHLYRYKKYTDVRLVWAPEMQIGFFGGDPDNFEYPRFCLDAAFFRAYENGKPAKVQHYLKWSKAGAAENELVFVSGHPGATSRLQTMADLTYKRDFSFPRLLSWLNRMEVTLNAWSGRSEENARRAKELLFSAQNSRKARDGGLAGLLDPKLMGKKQEAEEKLKSAVANDPKLAEARDAWKRIEEAQNKIKEVAVEYNALEVGRGFGSRYFEIARTILRAVEERPKAEGDRLREFRESARESLEFDLFSAEPLYDDYEQVKLATGLTYLCQELGYTNALVQKVLNGKSPRDRAAGLVAQTKVKDVNARKALYQSKPEELASINDPMIQLARLVDSEARRVRKIVEGQDELKRQAYAAIARAKFAMEGPSSYPDATFTLRLSYGAVKGYQENGKNVPHQTTFEGLYERAKEHNYRPPFDLPKRWLDRKDKLDLNTPYNFVATTDIIGGNSGSPVINKNAEVVGLIFDGNIHSLVLDFAYTDELARAVSVHSSSILEALRKVYDAPNIAEELTTGRRPASTL